LVIWTFYHKNFTKANLIWGVKTFYYDKFVSTDDTIDDVNRIATEKGLVSKGDMLINLAAMPIANKGMVNTLRVTEIE
jgi:pyruvate kinase